MVAAENITGSSNFIRMSMAAFLASFLLRDSSRNYNLPSYMSMVASLLYVHGSFLVVCPWWLPSCMSMVASFLLRVGDSSRNNNLLDTLPRERGIALNSFGGAKRLEHIIAFDHFAKRGVLVVK